ncbi:helix-turn-helix domain-containing protein [Sphingomonas faeni]|uniref:helix-turn-helix domain-containing protein n=1 Tax=Sphingomonas faeni TaxID=185950 RepID=UPI00278128CB|nr:helix-turn-helix transcriptional regulator [Sphingomonas faeni]MDQ0839264.1 transcriptional regulator with XRE-family HTH domain [Sphingomonas faeni]
MTIGTNDEPDTALLGRVFRRLRLHRRLSVAQVAEALDMPARTYANLEAGNARIHYDRIKRFAAYANVDPVAMQASTMFNSEGMALACCDNKLMMINLLAMEELFDELGTGIGDLEPRTIIAGFDQLKEGLIAAARKPDPFAEGWLTSKRNSVVALSISIKNLLQGRKRTDV